MCYPARVKKANMSERDIANVLAVRYASPAMRAIWSAEGRILLERELWIAVMKAQRDLGLEIPEEDIAAYERVKGIVNLESIDARERVTRHDVKARIEEFCELAGCQRGAVASVAIHAAGARQGSGGAVAHEQAC